MPMVAETIAKQDLHHDRGAAFEKVLPAADFATL